LHLLASSYFHKNLAIRDIAAQKTQKTPAFFNFCNGKEDPESAKKQPPTAKTIANARHALHSKVQA